MSRAVVPGLGGLLASLVATGCFDVHSVETGPLIIDDFEDGNVAPLDPTFQRWGCPKFLPPDEDECDIDDTGYISYHSLYLDATIHDVQDGIQQQGGALLETVATTTRDLGRFSRLNFVAKLESDGLPPLSKPTLDVQIGCKSAQLKPGPRPDAVHVDYLTEPLSNDWQVVKVELGDLAVPTGLIIQLQERAPGCLKVVDTIRFILSAGLPDGGSGRFTLHIDDVELE